MGQQQLLLLVLSTVIIGLATLAGVEAFSQSQRQSAIDHMTQKSVEIALDVQEYAQRPALFRPQNTTGDGDLDIGFSELSHYESSDDGSGGKDYVDDVATYSLNGHSSLPEAYSDDACPDNSPLNTVEAYSQQHDVSVCVSITGTSSDELTVGVE